VGVTKCFVAQRSEQKEKLAFVYIRNHAVKSRFISIILIKKIKALSEKAIETKSYQRTEIRFVGIKRFNKANVVLVSISE
jgi:hypothetical protein